MIEFRGVGKTYRPLLGRRVRAVDDLTFEIRRGEVLGLAGPNGAGKSTLIGMLLGFLHPSDGTVRIDGVAPRDYVQRHGMAYLSELIAIPPRWRAETALRRYGLLAGLPDDELDPRVEAVIAMLGLEEHRGKRVKALSKGNLQRLGLAQALLGEADVVVLDEPTHGLDPVWTQRFRDVVQGLRAPHRAIFIASHNLDELQRVADRVVIIDGGRVQRIVRTGDSDESNGAIRYRLTLARGGEHVSRVFPGAAARGSREFDLPPMRLPELNDGLTELLRLGALIGAFVPARSSLEEQFRQAVGEGGDS